MSVEVLVPVPVVIVTDTWLSNRLVPLHRVTQYAAWVYSITVQHTVMLAIEICLV